MSFAITTMLRWIAPHPGANSTRPQYCSIPRATFMTVAMKDLALLIKYSFTNEGWLQEALDSAIIDSSFIASACKKFCAVSSNCARRRFRSIYQFSAHENVINNVGGPWPLATWWVIQCWRSSVLLLQKLSLPFMFLEMLLSICM